MARLSLFRFRFSLLALSKISTRKLLTAINLGIFISIFAVSAAIISIYFENKIDKLESKIIKEETYYIVYNNWLNRIPKIINELNTVLDQKEQIDNYTPLLKPLVKDDDWIFYGNRQDYFSHYYYLRDLIEMNFLVIRLSLSDAALVSNSQDDIHAIIMNRSLKNLQIRKFDKVYHNHISYKKKHYPEVGSRKMAYEKYYLEYAKFNIELKSLILFQKKYFLEFALPFFSVKKSDFQKSVIILQNEIKELSKLESRFILFAFFIQFLIFVLVQFFEVTLEQQNTFKRKKK